MKMNKVKGRLCQIVNKFSFLELLFEVECKAVKKGETLNELYGFRTCIPIPYKKRFYKDDEEKKHGYEINGIYEITIKKAQ